MEGADACRFAKINEGPHTIHQIQERPWSRASNNFTHEFSINCRLRTGNPTVRDILRVLGIFAIELKYYLRIGAKRLIPTYYADTWKYKRKLRFPFALICIWSRAELVLRRTIVPTMASLANSMAYVFGSGTGEMLIGPVGFIACATLSNSSPYVVLEAMPPANP